MTSNFAICQQTGLMSGIFSLSYYLSDRYATDRYIRIGEKTKDCWDTIEILITGFNDDFFNLADALFPAEEAQKRIRNLEGTLDSLYFEIGDLLDPILSNKSKLERNYLVSYFSLLLIRSALVTFMLFVDDQNIHTAIEPMKSMTLIRQVNIEPLIDAEIASLSRLINRTDHANTDFNIAVEKVNFLCSFVLKNSDRIEMFSARNDDH